MTLKTLTSGSTGSSRPAKASAARSVASGIRLRVLLPLAAAMLLLAVVFVSVFIFETRHRQAEGIARTAASVDAMFREQSAEGIQVMGGTLTARSEGLGKGAAFTLDLPATRVGGHA